LQIYFPLLMLLHHATTKNLQIATISQLVATNHAGAMEQIQLSLKTVATTVHCTTVLHPFQF
jgi:hypothetical protein